MQASFHVVLKELHPKELPSYFKISGVEIKKQQNW